MRLLARFGVCLLRDGSEPLPIKGELCFPFIPHFPVLLYVQFV